MYTTILAWVIIALGIASIATGAWGSWTLVGHRRSTATPIPVRYWGFAVAMVAGGVGLIGIGQGLRLLLLIVGRLHYLDLSLVGSGS
jgi:hypothetical protein